jgi:hypothetical protein
LFPFGGAAVAVALGWGSAMLHVAGKAPVGLLSLGVGVVLGLLLVALAVLTSTPSRRTLIVAAVLLAILTAVAEHGWLYQAYRQKWRQNRVEQPAAAFFRPDDAPLSLTGYIQRELNYSPGQWKFWLLDAGLILCGAAGVVLVRDRVTDAGSKVLSEDLP